MILNVCCILSTSLDVHNAIRWKNLTKIHLNIAVHYSFNQLEELNPGRRHSQRVCHPLRHCLFKHQAQS